MPLHKDKPGVEIFVFNLGQHQERVNLTNHGRDQMFASYDKHLRQTHLGLTFCAQVGAHRQAAEHLQDHRPGHIPDPIIRDQLDPLWVDQQDDLPGISLEQDLKTLRLTQSRQTLDNVLKLSRRAMVLRGHFPEFLIRIADHETSRSLHGRIKYAILIVTESPLAEMAWPGSMVHRDLLRPADIVHYTIVQGKTCRDWTIQPNPKILRCPLDT